MFTDIEYETEAKLAAEELLAFYSRQRHQTSGSREKIQHMLDSAFCVVTARRKGELIGFARGVLNGTTGCLAECKLDPVYQGPACVTKKDGRVEHDDSGIAHEMAVRVIKALRDHDVEKIGTVAHGTEVDFCRELGFKQPKGVVWLELSGGAPLSAEKIAASSAAV